jgi:hypothetical protein
MLKPEVSLPIAAATGAVVFGIYQSHLPTVAETRVTSPGHPAIQSSRKTATWMAAAVVGGISLIAADPTIFIVGGIMVVALDFTHRHADAVNPATNKMVASGEGAATQAYPGNGAAVMNDAGSQGA